MISFEEHKAEYDARFAASKAAKRCFCICGHDAPGQEDAILGTPLPCEQCFTESRTKAGKGLHGRVPLPAESYSLMEMEQDSIVAESYVRSVANRGPAFIAGLWERLISGKPLTYGQVDAVIRSKEAEARSGEALVKREAKAAKKVEIDLDRVYIPFHVEGDYAVDGSNGELIHVNVERPVDGTFRDFVIVTFHLGGGMTKQGVQYPQPYKDQGTYKQWYRGPLAHLVARLVSNADSAQARFQEAA